MTFSSVLTQYIYTAHEISRQLHRLSQSIDFALSMEDSNDWPAGALDDPNLVAAALLTLRRASWPVESAPSPAATMELPPAWPCHARRPRKVWCRRIGDGASWGRIRNSKVADAAAGGGGGSWGKSANSKYASASRRRLSPMTPLEYQGGSGASRSAGDEIVAKRSRNGGTNGVGCGSAAGRGTKMVVTGEREMAVFNEPNTNLSLTKKKLALPEIQTMHQALLEHRGFLQKELEAQRSSKVALLAKNRELNRQKLRIESQKRTSTALPVSEEEHPKRLRLCDSFVPLPDLNIALVGEWD